MEGVSVVNRAKVKKKSVNKLKKQQQIKTPSPQQKKMKKIKLSALNGVREDTVVSGSKQTNSKLFGNNNAIDCLDGMSSAELTMVKRLAGNDPVARKKTLRKLKKWLSVLSQKVPDSPDSRSMIEPNFIRVWKALFYCMWMADKPLPQEQLAESISDLQHIFATKTGPFLLFVEWFIRTIAREWSWIDRFRMDKFMMLFRRFLRKTLVVISERKWQNDVLEGYMKIISTFIFNRHPPKSKKQVAKQAPIPFAPLGLQIHFTDIFMEELAKVGGENLKFQKTLKVLTIFMNELSFSNDDRLLGEIRERIFNHLMKQSDVGIDYQEEMTYGGVENVEEQEDEEAEDGKEKLGEEDQFLEDEAENDTEMESNGVMDPRAGAVDVILPQLDVDYAKLYQKLIEHGGQKEVKLKNRRILYSLASQFKELTEGKYPLALPQEDSGKLAIPRKEIMKAAKELVEMELDETSGRPRKTKKQRKRELKKMQMQELNQSADSVGSEDNSKYIQDEELLDHVTDNYMSYLEDEVEADDEEPEAPVVENDEVDGEKEKEEKPVSLKKSKKRKWKTVVDVDADDDEEEAPKLIKCSPDVSPDENKEKVIVVKRPRKRLSLGNSNSPAAASTPVLKGKVRRLTELVRTPINFGAAAPSPSSLTKSANKRVSFVLNRNLEHDHADYPVSIARSPAIPYDKHRRPSYGLLKSPMGTPNKSSPIIRASALDFF